MSMTIPKSRNGVLSVLLVDDTEGIRQLLRLTLATQPRYDVVGEARDGLEAIRRAEELQPDLILLDMAMPVMDGLQALPRIVEASPASTIVVFSGFAAEKLENEALALGARAYVEKGLAPKELVARLDEVLGETPELAEILPIRRHRTTIDIDGAGERIPDRQPTHHSRNRTQDADRLLTELIDVVAHDLRSPLTVIKGMVSTILARWDGLPASRRTEMLKTVVRNADEMNDLVEGMLDAARAESGSLQVTPKTCHLGDLVRQVTSEIGSTRGRHTVVLAEQHLPAAHADPLRQRQILSNLLSNAFKFSPPSEPVTIAIVRQGGFLHVSVSDRGVGIDPRMIGRLFTKFGRLSDDEDTPRGIGLGLYISRMLVQAQGGSISVESSPGRGSTFSYTVRVADDLGG